MAQKEPFYSFMRKGAAKCHDAGEGTALIARSVLGESSRRKSCHLVIGMAIVSPHLFSSLRPSVRRQGSSGLHHVISDRKFLSLCSIFRFYSASLLNVHPLFSTSTSYPFPPRTGLISWSGAAVAYLDDVASNSPAKSSQP